MQYVNDDMDDLFRRAAENYPLDTHSADWNKVLAALQGDKITQKVPEQKTNKNGRLLWLLLLLPFGLICNQLYKSDVFKNDEVPQSVEGSYPDKIQAPESDVIKQNDINSNDKNSTEKNIETQTAASNDPLNKTENINSGSQLFRSHDVLNLSNNTVLKTNNSVFKKTTGRGKTNLRNDFVFNQPSESAVTENSGMDDNLPYQRNYVSQIDNQSLQLPQPEFSVKRSLNPSVVNASHPSKSPVRVQRPKKFYAGFMGGIDATTIKFQKIENSGFNYGIVFGYQLNKKWSLETGAYMEKKYYYSQGKYFNTSKIYMPANTWIEDLNGNCKMIEVPLSARYSFGGRKQSNWFTTFGFTSYFLKQENYTYNYYYGTVGPVPHTKEYNNASTHLLSNVSISGGYTHQLGNFADLRIEPYLKLPVSGMGVGSLPMLSTGLQIGLTRKF